MKLEHLLLLAGAVGAGYLYAKHRTAAAVLAPATMASSVTPIARTVVAVPDEGDEYFYGYGYPYPVWGGGWGRGGRRGGGHGGGHGHGGHGGHGGGHHGGHH